MHRLECTEVQMPRPGMRPLHTTDLDRLNYTTIVSLVKIQTKVYISTFVYFRTQTMNSCDSTLVSFQKETITVAITRYTFASDLLILSANFNSIPYASVTSSQSNETSRSLETRLEASWWQAS